MKNTTEKALLGRNATAVNRHFGLSVELKGKVFVPFALEFFGSAGTASVQAFLCFCSTHLYIFPQSPVPLSAPPCHPSRGLEWHEKRMRSSGRAPRVGQKKGVRKKRKEEEKKSRGV